VDFANRATWCILCNRSRGTPVLILRLISVLEHKVIDEQALCLGQAAFTPEAPTMEVEAKFVLPDTETFQRLQAIDRLAGFALSAAQVRKIRDTYLDTQERSILVAGYACRQREQDEGLLITLKGLGGAEGAVHRRATRGLAARSCPRPGVPVDRRRAAGSALSPPTDTDHSFSG
jgi:hypothetical protein